MKRRWFPILALFLIWLESCSGGGGGSIPPSSVNPGDSGSGGDSGNNGLQTHSVKTLAKGSPGSNGATSAALALSGGRIYFNDRGAEPRSVPVGGGEIITHWAWEFFSLHRLYHAAGKLFMFELSGDGGLFSIPDTAVGITTLSAAGIGSLRDIVTDGTNVYWGESGKGVLGIPRVPTAFSPLELGRSTNQLFSSSDPYLRIVLDGNVIFISESQSGDIYRLDLATGSSTKIVSALNANQLSTLPFENALPLVVTEDALYALVNRRNIVRIDKQTGASSTAVSTFQAEGKIKSDAAGVYWWQADFPGIRLMRLDSKTGVISTVTVAPDEIRDTMDVDDFYSDGSDIWWANRVITTSGDIDIEIQHVPVAGGQPVLTARFNATLGLNNGLAAVSLTGDATDLYWLGQATVIMKISKSGGTPQIVTGAVNGGLTSLVVTGSELIWGENWVGRVRKMPKEGQPIATVEWAVPMAHDFSYQPVDTTIDETSLYWSVYHYNTKTGDASTVIYTMPVAGGPVQEVGTFPRDTLRIFSGGDYLFLIRWTPTGHILSYFPKTGGALQDIVPDVPFNFNDPADIFVKNGVAYIALEKLYAYDLATHGLTPIKMDLPDTSTFISLNPNKIYVDDSHIYWSSAAEGKGGVYRIPISGGMLEILYSGQPSSQLTGDEAHIYWIAGWDILALDKEE